MSGWPADGWWRGHGVGVAAPPAVRLPAPTRPAPTRPAPGRRSRRLRTACLLAAGALLAGCAGSAGNTGNTGTGVATTTPPGPATSGTVTGGPGGSGSTGKPAPGRPAGAPEHVVVVVMENRGYADVVGNPDAPWLNALPAAVFTDWHGVTHPSQPNYLALFSGSTQGVTDDHCPRSFPGPDLGRQVLDAGLSFAAYSEGLPGTGDPTCGQDGYVRKHAPWADFTDLPGSVAHPFTDFPSDYTRLPTLSFVIPDLCHDTHDCPVGTGDAWLRSALGGYADWARSHASLLVITYDEDDGGESNHIPTLVAGAGVRPGRYPVRGDHYTLLRTLEALFGLPTLGQAAARTSVASAWS
ncbi:MAG TPA: alkaline phosphatase family protein [Kineosporiaceae bacterium]|nr:alkaline phosphatase family protein [Kineosporiaceae bacterium]